MLVSIPGPFESDGTQTKKQKQSQRKLSGPFEINVITGEVMHKNK